MEHREDGLLTDPQFQFIHYNSDEPLLFLGRHVTQHVFERLLHACSVFVGVAQRDVAELRVHFRNLQRSFFGASRLQYGKRHSCKVSSILKNTSGILGINNFNGDDQYEVLLTDFADFGAL